MKKTILLKSMLLLCALIVGSSYGWAEEAVDSYTATSSDKPVAYNGTKEGTVTGTNSITWSYSVTQNTAKGKSPYSAYSDASGWQLGSGNSPCTAFSISTSGIIGTISKIEVVTGSASASANMNCTVGGSNFGTQNQSTGSGATVSKQTFSGTASGAIVVSSTASTAAFYFKSITVTYTAVTGEVTTTTIDDSGITNRNKFVSTEAGSFSASVTYGSPAAAVPEASVSWSSSKTGVATINPSTGEVTLVAAGTTTITASYAGVDDEYQPSYAEYELTVTDEDPNAVTLWSEDFQTYDADDIPSGGVYSYTCVNGTSNTRVYGENNAGGVTPELLVGKNGGYFQAVVPITNIKGNLVLKFLTNAKKITVSTSTDGVSISGDYEFTAAGEHTVTFTGITTSMSSITIRFTPGTSDNVRLDNIVLKTSLVSTSVTLGTNGYATFASPYPLDLTTAKLPAGLTAYKAAINGTVVEFNEFNQKVPANTGIMLKGAATDPGTSYDITVTSEGTSVTGNAFLVNAGGGTFDADGAYNYFGLKKNTLIFGLFDPSAVAIPADKAYLKLSKSTPANELICVFDDGETTGINNVERMTINNERYYNLNGQRVAQPTKGLYIVNGKKVVIK